MSGFSRTVTPPTIDAMASLADVFRELNRLKEDGVVADYALGGATATLFYTDPSRTYDVDVFVSLSSEKSPALVSLTPIYEWARARGFGEDAEHVLVHGVPVQFLPGHNTLAEEAIATARTEDYEGVPVRVVGPEHLAALAFQAGGGRRRERGWQLLDSGKVDEATFRELIERHGIDLEGK